MKKTLALLLALCMVLGVAGMGPIARADDEKPDEVSDGRGAGR